MPIEYRPAWPDETALVLRLFRVPFRSGPHLRIFVASATEPRERVVGCFVSCATPALAGGDGRERCYFVWRLLPGYEDGPVRAELLERGLVDVASVRALPLVTQDLLESADCPRAQLLAAHGFAQLETIDEYQAGFDEVWSRCRRIHERLERHGGVPAGGRVLSFEPGLLPAIRTALHNDHIMNTAEFDARVGGENAERVDLERSTAIVVNDELVGLMAVSPVAGERGYVVSGRWVDPGYRNGWVNAELIYNSVRQGVPLGLEFVRFVASQKRHQETARLAIRLGGEPVRRLIRYARASQ